MHQPVTFPFSGMALFIILAMLAMGKNRSCSLNGVFFDVPPSLQESSELSTVIKKARFNIFLELIKMG